MFKFLSEAKQELEHVVWPTPAETKKYMMYTVGVIVVMAIILAIVGYGFQETLQYVREWFPKYATQQDLNNMINTLSGEFTVSGENASGVTITPISTFTGAQ